MNEWLIAALAAGLTVFLIVSLFYLHMFAKYRERFLLFWGTAWTLHALRNGVILSGAYLGPSKVVMVAEQYIVLAVSIFLLKGACEFTGRNLFRLFPPVVAAAALWVPGAVYGGLGAPWLYIPTYFFFGISQVFSGAAILRYMPRQGLGSRVCGWSLILWGVHHLDYPFLRPVAAFAPWGFLIGAALALLSAISMLLIYLEKLNSELETSELRFRRFVDNTMDGLVMVRSGGDVVDVNDEACSLARRSREELVGRPVIGLFSPEEALRSALSEVSDGGASSVELSLCAQDGACVPVEAKVSTFQDGPERFALICVRDITERRRAEAKLRESELRNRRIVENSADGSYLADFDGRILDVNEAACRILGYTREEILGLNVADIDPDLPSYGFRAHWESIPDEQPVTIETRHRCKDGTLKEVEVHACRFTESGQVFILGWARDVTERMRTLSQLKQARLEAEAANRTKSDFLANMSHEIRTPLNGLLGMLQLLEMSQLDQDQSECCQLAVQSVNRLTRLLTDILDLSRVEAGKLTIRSDPFNLREILDQVIGLYTPFALQSGLQLHMHVYPGLPETLVGDAVRLQQVLTNLIGNAFKFTSRGHVVVEAYPLPTQNEGQQRIFFSVSDTGCGIAEADLARLFQPFSQLSQGFTRTHQGAGLGLSICRQLVALMGGSMAVESEPGLGTSFHFCVTLGHDPSSGVTAGNGRSLSDVSLGRRVLLAEDDDVSRFSVWKLLEMAGYTVRTAGNGQEVLECLEKDIFDVILMDVQMPFMDGVEATRIIRGSGRQFAKIPIIAMTAYAMAGDRERFAAAGMDGYVSKPVSLERLLEAIRSVPRHHA